MDWDDFNKSYTPKADSPRATWNSEGCKNLANAAIKRAIQDGDVIPTSIVRQLFDNVSDMSDIPNSFIFKANKLLDEYIQEIKS